MGAQLRIGLGILLISLSAALAVSAGDDSASTNEFTGEILTLLYVTDVRQSVAFYQAVGFDHSYYYDYQEDEYTRSWDKPYPPEYAEMTRGSIRIGLTTADEEDQVYGGGVRHYFIVTDVWSHYSEAKKNGIVAEPDEVEARPWMDFFTLSDPDGHQIVFGTKNQAYYDEVQELLAGLP